ncbi:hypothetical protein BDA96_10G048100 [Sorghum bicolor]|uniref:Uncharacterized protein n=1 Tax=Sorghum bicolor TaxID=4558 RepID=A0A921Q2A2_SORBI|nr:hypothetical protein BDA96_10G048100 [Sorghum bicolor]
MDGAMHDGIHTSTLEWAGRFLYCLVGQLQLEWAGRFLYTRLGRPVEEGTRRVGPWQLERAERWEQKAPCAVSSRVCTSALGMFLSHLGSGEEERQVEAGTRGGDGRPEESIFALGAMTQLMRSYRGASIAG